MNVTAAAGSFIDRLAGGSVEPSSTPPASTTSFSSLLDAALNVSNAPARPDAESSSADGASDASMDALHYGLRTEGHAASERADEETENADDAERDGGLAVGRTDALPPGIANRDELPAGAAHAAAHAAVHGAAAVARPNAASSDLTSELREKVQRVIDRMRDEHGHDVRLVETSRSQERQDWLYEQGRTRPGSVVTWTRDSQHTHGRAADVMIDGTWDDPAAYERLQRIAREEGLRTLGTRDPGHLELPRGVADALRAAVVESADASPESVAQPAAVAEVASVATVATVAAVATPGEPGALRRAALRGGEGRAKASAEAIAAQAHRGVEVAARDGRRRVSARAESQRDEAREQGRDAAREGRTAAAPAHAHAHFAEPAAPAAVQRTDATSRIARVLELQDGAASRPMSHITLRLDNDAGGVDRIRVDLRGSDVDARIDVGDSARAESLGARLGELREALGRHGLQADTVRISAAARGAEAEAGRLAATAGLGGSERAADASAQSQHQQQHQRDAQRDGARDQQRDPRGRTPRDAEGDDARHRSRREHRHGDRS